MIFKQDSSVISFLRFPLIVLVVLIHTYVPYDNDNIAFYHWDLLISRLICGSAVPLFFLISGYLFFNQDKFNYEIYKSKIKSRVKTLLLPYFVWNSIVLFYYFVRQNNIPIKWDLPYKLISDYSMSDFLYAYWNTYLIDGISSYGFPTSGQFWFIRNLFICCLLSPIVYFLIKKQKD